MSAESLPKSIIGINFDPENNGLPVPKKVKDLFLDKAVYGLAGSAFKDVGLNPPRALLSYIVSHYCQQFPFFLVLSAPNTVYYHIQNHDLLIKELRKRSDEIGNFISDDQREVSG